jgi:hypothetical protein
MCICINAHSSFKTPQAINVCDVLVLRHNRTKEEMLEKLDVFLLNNRLTQEKYSELVKMLG